MKIAFVGDISFNDDYIKLYNQKINPFSPIEPILNKFDFVVGNLECLVEGKDGENELKKPRLKTNLDTLNYLNNINVKLVSLANNHIYDNLTDGYLKTTEFLKNNNINYLGAGLSEKEARTPYLIEDKKKRICIFSYVSEDTNPKLPLECDLKLNWFNLEKVKQEIEEYKKLDYFIVLYNHWGGNYENGYYPEKELVKICHELVDIGADLIIGHHSHTLQPYEVYKDKYIFYSLGNFCFSDIYFESRVKKILNLPRFTESVIISIDLNKNGYSCELTPIKNKKLFIVKSHRVLKKYKNRQVIFKIVKRNRLAWRIYNFGLKRIFPYYRLLRNYKEISFIRNFRSK